MRIAIDATPAIAQRGGVGRYTHELLRALVQESLEHRFTLSVAADARQVDGLLHELPPGAWREVRRLPASERVMTALWQRLRLPLGIERWIGPHDLYHGTDFTLPPTQGRTVVTIHDLSFMLHPELCHPDLARYLQSAVPRSILRADAVIAVSASVAAEIARAFPAARVKTVAIPNGIRLPSSCCEPPRRAQPIVLMVGTIEPRKNHLTILAAMREVRARMPDARLVIAGRRGWMDDRIVEAIEKCRSEGWLDWYLAATDTELEALYRLASVFVAASHYEGFGLPLLEALARGLPAVASDIAAHREVAGDAALYAAATEPEAYVSAITTLLESPELHAEQAARGIQRSHAFSWRETARRTLRVYANVGMGQGP